MDSYAEWLVQVTKLEQLSEVKFQFTDTSLLSFNYISKRCAACPMVNLNGI